jgi:di- and tripeptidase
VRSVSCSSSVINEASSVTIEWHFLKHHIGYIYSLAYENKKNLLFSGSGDSNIAVWNTNTMKFVRNLHGHTGGIYALLIHINSLYSGSQDSTIRIWDIDTLGCIRTLSGHKADVICLTSSLESKVVFSGGSDGVIRVWDIANHFCLRELSTKKNVLCMHCTANKLFSGTNDTNIQSWNISRQSGESPRHFGGIPECIGMEEKCDLLMALRECISFKSVSGDPVYQADCWSCAKYLQSMLESMGAQVRAVQDRSKTSNPCIIARLGNDPLKQTIAFYAHYDVQPADSRDGWRSNPFSLSGSDGYLYGRGVSDDKGPLLAVIFAVKELLRDGALAVNIVFLLEGEGENGSIGFDEIVESNFDMLEGISSILISNNYWLGENSPCLTYGLRGQIKLVVNVHGARTVLHSGMDGGLFLEPIADLVRVISCLTDCKSNKVLIPGFYDNVIPQTEEETLLYENLDFDAKTYVSSTGLKVESDILGTNQELLLKRWRHPSLTIHNIETPVINGSLIPNVATANISIRIVPNQCMNDITNTCISFLRTKFEELSTCNSIEVFTETLI